MYENIEQGIFSLIQSFMGNNVDWGGFLLIAMMPIFIIAVMIEYTVKKINGDTRSFYWKEIVTNFSLGFSYLGAETLVAMVTGGIALTFFYEHRVFDIPINLWTAIPLFLAVELSFYVFHRVSHRVRWFWAAHVPHHSGKNMNFSTAARQSVLNSVVGAWVFYAPLAYLGVPPAVIGSLLAVNLAYQYFLHTEIITKLPNWFEFIFNTPSHHRVHHGKNTKYIDKNYGGTLIIFDRLFGTFEPEQEKVIYGITNQIESNNPLILNIHELVDMLRDAMAPGPVSERIKHFFMPPDWTREGHTPIRTWRTTTSDTEQIGDIETGNPNKIL